MGSLKSTIEHGMVKESTNIVLQDQRINTVGVGKGASLGANLLGLGPNKNLTMEDGDQLTNGYLYLIMTIVIILISIVTNLIII